MDHIPDDLLDEYALGRVGEPACSEIEQHLLTCEQCREALEEIERIRRMLRAAEEEGKQ